ncbi:uncharacterized protein LOC127799891 isoform X2 [Diospyros lotus]|uniref:uncharacterized protein LOC127799891 isoform X2 n=1 Tax=Diospyros lotus TaxID=55363 RepID=UPI00224D4E6E|nr:uncharacterized protein LOC127799891 isoform X2 [Diospyros lotus]
MEEAGEPKESPNDKKIQEKRAKSCKGCLYYSSTFKSDSRSPLCVGLTRSLPRVPNHIVGESEMEASREGRSLADFKYACVGYSVYSDGKDPSIETKSELPVCVGLEILVDKRVNTNDSVPAPVHNKEDSLEMRVLLQWGWRRICAKWATMSKNVLTTS